jgi:hypothetical protein
VAPERGAPPAANAANHHPASLDDEDAVRVPNEAARREGVHASPDEGGARVPNGAAEQDRVRSPMTPDAKVGADGAAPAPKRAGRRMLSSKTTAASPDAGETWKINARNGRIDRGGVRHLRSGGGIRLRHRFSSPRTWLCRHEVMFTLPYSLQAARALVRLPNCSVGTKEKHT